MARAAFPWTSLPPPCRDRLRRYLLRKGKRLRPRSLSWDTWAMPRGLQKAFTPQPLPSSFFTLSFSSMTTLLTATPAGAAGLRFTC